MADLNKLIKNKVKEKKVILGFNSVLKTLKSKKLNRVIYANNLPDEKIRAIKHNAGLADTEITEYPNDGMELGLVCGKPFSVGVIGIKGSEK